MLLWILGGLQFLNDYASLVALYPKSQTVYVEVQTICFLIAVAVATALLTLALFAAVTTVGVQVAALVATHRRKSTDDSAAPPAAAMLRRSGRLIEGLLAAGAQWRGREMAYRLFVHRNQLSLTSPSPLSVPLPRRPAPDSLLQSRRGGYPQRGCFSPRFLRPPPHA